MEALQYFNESLGLLSLIPWSQLKVDIVLHRADCFLRMVRQLFKIVLTIRLCDLPVKKMA